MIKCCPDDVLMGSFYNTVREVSQDLIQMLEDFMDDGQVSVTLYENIIEDHQGLLRGISDASIIGSTYSKTYKFLQSQVALFKQKTSFTNVVLCRVMSRRVRDVIISSLRETQPIAVQPPDKKKP